MNCLTRTMLGRPDQHPNIVRVRQFIEANDTAYMVMDFEKGQPLSNIIEERGTLKEEELAGILDALLDGLARLHEANVWHRDIKPSNILIRPDGSPVLIDFGAARKDVSGETKSIMVFFSPAYAAPEQIYAMGDQGPWTDIYGLGATLYKAVTGVVPTNAAKRLQNEKYIPAVEAAKDTYSPAFLQAIDAALTLLPKYRPRSVAAWKNLFYARTGVRGREDLNDEEKTLPARVEAPERRKGYHALPAIAAVLITLAVVNWWIWFRHAQPPPEPVSEANTASQPVKVPPLIRAQLSIESVPAAASVFLNDEFKGKTPLNTEVTAGPYTFRLSLEHYHDWESTLLIEQKDDIPIRVPLLKNE